MTHNPQRYNDVAEFFAANANRLERAIRKRTFIQRDLIEDACASAWARLLRRPDITLDRAGFGWLVAVAVNEAFQLLRKTKNEFPAGGFRAIQDDERHIYELPEPASDSRGVDELALARLERDERLAALRSIKPQDRQALFLRGMGYSYREIMAITDASYTAVNRRVTEGRAALRGLADAAI